MSIEFLCVILNKETTWYQKHETKDQAEIYTAACTYVEYKANALIVIKKLLPLFSNARLAKKKKKKNM